MGRKSIAKERRAQIIQAFYRCAVENGQAAASIRNIAQMAGVQPSTLHHYFKGRDEIIEESVVYFTDMIFDDFHEQMKTTGAAEQLAKGMEFIFSKGMINNDYTGFFLECCVAARKNPKIRRTIADLFSRFREAIIEHLQQMPGFTQMTLKDQKMLAATVVALHEGIELQWFAAQKDVNLPQFLKSTSELIQTFIQMKSSHA